MHNLTSHHTVYPAVLLVGMYYTLCEGSLAVYTDADPARGTQASRACRIAWSERGRKSLGIRRTRLCRSLSSKYSNDNCITTHMVGSTPAQSGR